MPAVEALGLGLPVLTTTCGSLAEVTLGMAEYIERPLDEKEFASKISTMLDDPSKFAPTTQEVATLRDAYSPDRVASEYCRIMTG